MNLGETIQWLMTHQDAVPVSGTCDGDPIEVRRFESDLEIFESGGWSAWDINVDPGIEYAFEVPTYSRPDTPEHYRYSDDGSAIVLTDSLRERLFKLIKNDADCTAILDAHAELRDVLHVYEWLLLEYQCQQQFEASMKPL